MSEYVSSPSCQVELLKFGLSAFSVEMARLTLKRDMGCPGR